MSSGTPSQLEAIEVVERVTSALSLAGTSFIFVTFLAFPAFHDRPINRLIFYASLGNTISNIGTLISTSGVAAGQSSSLCQLQGWIIQL